MLLGLQLGVTYWFYLYLSWLLGPLLVAVLGRYGTSTWSIESARPDEEARTTTALTQGSSSDGSNRTDIWVRRLSMACSRTTPSTPPRAPGHPHVGDVGGPARQDAGVGRRDVGVGPHDRRGPAVEEPAHRDLLARRLGVHVDEDVVDAALESRQGRLGLLEEGVGGVDVEVALQAHDPQADAVALDDVSPRPGCERRKLAGRTTRSVRPR